MTRTLFRILVMLLIGGSLVAALVRIQQNTRVLQKENRTLAGAAAAREEKLEAAVQTQAALQTELEAAAARLAEATNATSLLAAERIDAQNRQHEKLRGEIARLSSDSVGFETQLAALRTQHQELQAARNQADGALRTLQAAHAAASNEIARLKGADADKAARIATRDQELANVRSELDAAKRSVQELTAAKTSADQALQALQAKSGADQAELAALRQRVAELQPKPAEASK